MKTPARKTQLLTEDYFIYNSSKGYTRKQVDDLLLIKQNTLPSTNAITIQQVTNLQDALDMITPIANYEESNAIYLLDEANQILYNLKDSDTVDVVKENNSIKFNIKRTDGQSTVGLPIITGGIGLPGIGIPSLPSLPIPGGIPVAIGGTTYAINNINFASGFNFSVNGDTVSITTTRANQAYNPTFQFPKS